MNKPSDDMTRDLPEGTVTFLFTDIEGSTELLRKLGEEYMTLLADHHQILRSSFKKWNGREVGTDGDAFFVSFPRATDAVAAVVEAQRAFAKNEWPRGVTVRVRMGLHTGEPWTAQEDYVGMDVHRAARIAHVGHGGQVLLSETTTALLKEGLPKGVRMLDLGRHQLKDMAYPEHIRQLVIRGLRSDYPPLKSLEAIDDEKQSIPNNLPVQSTPFVGRKEELADLEKLLGDPDIRLVTVVGPGGMGKTRLALAAAERQLDIHTELSKNGGPRYPNGVFFVPLDGLDNSAQIVPEIARSLGLRLVSPGESGGGMGGPERSPEEQLLDYLSNKQLLLVVDNFEHVLEGAGLIAEFRQRTPEVQILVTSREKLGLHGEQQYQLKGMRVPQKDINVASANELLAEYSSSKLFLQSAGRNTPDFALQPGDTRDLSQICQLVDGMPLALELAAGWVDVLSLSDIAAEIREGLDFLETDALDMPDRHHSVEAIFEGTWRRLEPTEQLIFAQLCVFRGGFTRQAARQITGATLRQLSRLMNKSLLLFDRQTSRYDIHRLLRHCGLDRLSENPEVARLVKDEHSSYFCDSMKHWTEMLKGPQYRQAMMEMEDDGQNMQAAWEWSVSQCHVDQLNNSVEALHSYYVRSGRASQWSKACARAVDQLVSSNDPDAKRARANLLLRQGWFLDDEADLALVQQGMDFIAELEPAGHAILAEKAFALLRLGGLRRAVGGSVDESALLLRQSQDIYQSLGDEYGAAMVQVDRGWLAFGLGDFVETARLFNASLQTRKSIGDRIGELNSLQALAGLARYQDELGEAQQIEKQIIAVRRQDGDQLALAYSLNQYGFTLWHLGDYKEARTTFHECTNIFYDLGLYEFLDQYIWEDTSALMDGDYECADKYRQAEEGRYDSWGLMQFYVLEMVGFLEMVRFNYSQARKCFEKAMAITQEYQRWVEIGMVQAWLALSLISMNLPEDSKDQLCDALRMTLKTKSGPPLMHCLPAAALFLAREGQSEQAVEIYEVACTFPHVANSRLFADVVGNEIGAIADSLPPEVSEAARKRGRERNPWEAAEELLAELEAEEALV